MADEYIEGFGPKPGSQLGPLAPGAPGGQGVQFFDLPSEESSKPALAQPEGLKGLVQQGFSAADQFLKQARAGTTRMMTQTPQGQPAMGQGGNIAANLLNPVPGSLPQAGMLLTGPTAGLVARGPLARGAVTGGLDALLGGVEGGPLGAVLGGVGGALSGAGASGVSKLGQPSRGMRALQQTKQMGLKYGSPEVQQWLRGMQEQELTRGSALKGLQDAASKGIEDILGHVKTTLPPNQRVTVAGLDPRIIARYNASQTDTSKHLAGVTGQFGGTDIIAPFEVMDGFRTWLRGRGDPAWRNVMDEMVLTADLHANSLGNSPAGQAYRAALKQYALDKRLLDLVGGIQDVRSKGILGGLNPTDFPEAQNITDLALKGKGQQALGAAEVAVGSAHPGMFGTLHMLRGAKKLVGGSGKQPIEGPLKPPPGPVRKALAETGAGAVGALPGVPRLPEKDEE